MKKTTKIMLIAAICAAFILTGCSTNTVTIQPVEYKTEWIQYQFNTPNQPDTIEIK
jgi:PBP1b-binding outer membrane lipoprotein LpoB